MLGDQLYESHGKVVGMRVLPNGKLEQTVITQGIFLGGEEFSDTYTSETEVKPDGTRYIEFHGFLTTKSGAMGKFSGIGNRMNRPDGSRGGRGAACYSNPPGKYARLNGIAVVWEAEVDKEGIIYEKGWEWK